MIRILFFLVACLSLVSTDEIVNSPGAIQAGGDISVSAEKAQLTVTPTAAARPVWVVVKAGRGSSFRAVGFDPREGAKVRLRDDSEIQLQSLFDEVERQRPLIVGFRAIIEKQKATIARQRAEIEELKQQLNRKR